ncbi:hypothetical protein CBM2600_A140415 [Cupriavidus taiwanensis]|nr:hypothetical protein CBM2600_A140415 [Cupriavidus taiwanensis]
MSMPRPAQADIRCSTVETRAPSFCSTDARRVSPMADAATGISTASGRSTRVKTMPVPAGAGRSVSVTLRPECRPMPTVFTRDLIVRCLSMTASTIIKIYRVIFLIKGFYHHIRHAAAGFCFRLLTRLSQVTYYPRLPG